MKVKKVWESIKAFLHYKKATKQEERQMDQTVVVMGQDVVIECTPINKDEDKRVIAFADTLRAEQKKIIKSETDDVVKVGEDVVLIEKTKNEDAAERFIYDVGVFVNYINSKDKYTNNWARMNGVPLIRSTQLKKQERRLMRYMLSQMRKEIGEF